jgi:hypothetical protein
MADPKPQSDDRPIDIEKLDDVSGGGKGGPAADIKGPAADLKKEELIKP